MSFFRHTLTAEGVIGNKGFQDFTTKSGKDAARVDVAVHPEGSKGLTVWYTVFCNPSTKKFITETCGYGPKDTIIFTGETKSYKTVKDGQYDKVMQDTVLWADDIQPGHKKHQQPSEIAGQQAQVPQQQYQQPPQQQYQQPPQPDMGYEAAKAAAAQADMQVPAQAPPQVPPQAPVQQPQQQAPAPQQMQMAPPQPNGQAADDETLPI